MAVLRHGETWLEFSEFAIISKKIEENRVKVCDIMIKVISGVGTVRFHE